MSYYVMLHPIQPKNCRCSDLGNGITLAGPRKAYSLNVQELKSFEGSGVSTDNKMAWCYKHIFIRGCRLDIPPESLRHNLSLNCIFTTDSGGLFFLHHILLYEQRYPWNDCDPWKNNCSFCLNLLEDSCWLGRCVPHPTWDQALTLSSTRLLQWENVSRQLPLSLSSELSTMACLIPQENWPIWSSCPIPENSNKSRVRPALPWWPVVHGVFNLGP